MLVWQCVFFIGAAIVLLLMSFWAVRDFRIERVYEFGNWTDILGSTFFWKVYLQTMLYAGIAAFLEVILAFPAVYCIAFKISPQKRRTLLMVLVVPFFTSYVVRTYAWSFILADEGLIDSALQFVGLPSVPLQGSLLAMEIGYLTYAFPLVALLVLLSLMNVDRTLIEASNNLGAGRLKSILHVVLPSARIGLVFGAAFGFILAMGDYIAPSTLGGSTRLTLSLLVIGATQAGGDFPQAAAIAVVMLVTLTVVLLLAFRLAFPVRRKAKK